MTGWRKWSLGMAFLVVGGVLGKYAIDKGLDGLGIGLMLGGLSSGVCAVVYGNVMEHRAKAAKE